MLERSTTWASRVERANKSDLMARHVTRRVINYSQMGSCVSVCASKSDRSLPPALKNLHVIRFKMLEQWFSTGAVTPPGRRFDFLGGGETYLG